MEKIKNSTGINQDRRRLLGISAMAVAAAELRMIGAANATASYLNIAPEPCR